MAYCTDRDQRVSQAQIGEPRASRDRQGHAGSNFVLIQEVQTAAAYPAGARGCSCVVFNLDLGLIRNMRWQCLWNKLNMITAKERSKLESST